MSDETRSGKGRGNVTIGEYIQMMDRWPDSWMGFPEDLHIGRQITAVLLSFVEYMIAQGLSRHTIRRHVDNLWALGGELIRAVNFDPSLRERPARTLVEDSIDSTGGALLGSAFSEQDQDPFDATCRKLHRFLSSCNHA
ncbi:MAG: hypothetical protein AB2813_13985 [Candidatus Sedimenticola endophacoides]